MTKQLRPVYPPVESRGRAWSLVIRIPSPPAIRDSNLPLYVHISRAIGEAITSGQLSPGTRLPGSRMLAAALRVHRNTILRAYDELQAEGWLSSVLGTGTFVSADLPSQGATRSAKTPTSPGQNDDPERRTRDWSDLSPFTLFPAHVKAPPPGVLQMFGGLGDLRLLPSETIARAYRRVLRRHPSVLAYTDPQGDAHLRNELAEMLRITRGLAVTAADVLITRGSQMALSLAARSILGRGAMVAVEQWGYPPAWEALRAAGAQLVPIKVDGQGLNVAHLHAVCERHLARNKPIKALYLTPHHQYPTTVSLSPARRVALLQLAATFGFTILEDDYDHEFHFDGQPLLPLASSAPEGVLYMGTLSKVIAPGLRIGYLVAPRPVLDRAVAHRYYFDRQGDAVGEAAIAELLEDGELQRHVRRARKHYLARRETCVELLRDAFAGALSFEVPSGGMALWLQVTAGPSVNEWNEQCVKCGVQFQPGAPFSLRGAADTVLRLGYAALTPTELESAVARLKQGWQRALCVGSKLV